DENRRAIREESLHAQKLTVWCAFWANEIIGPFFFEDDARNAERYKSILSNFLWSKLNIDACDVYFQQDGAMCHRTRENLQFLRTKFRQRVISRNADFNSLPRSCNLTPLDLFWGYDTKQSLPLFLVELEPVRYIYSNFAPSEPNINNKEIFQISKILNTIAANEPPRNSRVYKCAQNHLSTDCLQQERADKVKCYNCGGNYPASYKGCTMRKQLQRKLFTLLRNRTNNKNWYQSNSTTNPIESANEINNNYYKTYTQDSRTYAQVTSPLLRNKNLSILKSSQPTHWPVDLNKILDMSDLAIIKFTL
ncbi:hypothetical protein WH47_04087, partial [Habropoda laboriosa]